LKLGYKMGERLHAWWCYSCWINACAHSG